MTTQSYMKGKANKQVVDTLTAVLADTFVLYFKTHSFHWNVVGEHFKALHEMFEEQYNEIWTSTDEIAERIRALDANAPINLKEIQKHASIQETGQIPDAMEMVSILANDNSEIVGTIYKAIHAAQDAGDEATVDLLNGRTAAHEKAAWMLRSLAK